MNHLQNLSEAKDFIATISSNYEQLEKNHNII